MASSIPIPLRPAACIAANCGLEDRHGFRGNEVGRSRPLRCITRIQTACRVTCNPDAPNNFASRLGDANGDAEGYVCLSRTRHLLAPEKAIETFPRISVRNGFTWPTGDINPNYLHIHRGPPVRKTSRTIFVICHFPFGNRPLGGFLQQFHGVRHRCAVDLPTLQTAIEAL
jgi:hypothetical protein